MAGIGAPSGFSAPSPLLPTHDLALFDSGKPPLDEWLRARALKSEGRSARTWVVETTERVVGFYCLATGGVRHEDALLPKLRRNMPNPTPVIVLARLAVDKAFHGRGLGSALLRDAFRRSLKLHGEVGFAAIVVHALDDEAKAFYLRHGMQEFPAGSRTLYLTSETLARVLG